MPGELRKAQVNRSMQLPETACEVLLELLAQPCQFTQFLCRDVGQFRRWRPLLRSKPRYPQRIDRVGLGPLQFLLGKAPRARGIRSRDRVALC
jgi:hypothetical protein